MAKHLPSKIPSLLCLLATCVAANFDQHVRRSSTAASGQQNIVGGEPVEARPWFGVFNDADIICGASLIHPDIALTAAHCVDSDLPPTFSLRFNSTRRETGGTKVLVTNKVLHPDFNDIETEGNDLAILVLAESLSLDTIALNSDASIPEDGGAMYGVGFGVSDSLFFKLPEDLQGASFTAFGTCPECILAPVNNENIVCAQVLGGRTICFGDSGGPLLNGGPDSRLQVGITSYIGCYFCSLATEAGYTRVSTYYDWIQGQVCANSANPPASCTTASIADAPARITRREEKGLRERISNLIGKGLYHYKSIH